jgi:hypothetical protein
MIINSSNACELHTKYLPEWGLKYVMKTKWNNSALFCAITVCAVTVYFVDLVVWNAAGVYVMMCRFLLDVTQCNYTRPWVNDTSGSTREHKLVFCIFVTEPHQKAKTATLLPALLWNANMRVYNHEPQSTARDLHVSAPILRIRSFEAIASHTHTHTHNNTVNILKWQVS